MQHICDNYSSFSCNIIILKEVKLKKLSSLSKRKMLFFFQKKVKVSTKESSDVWIHLSLYFRYYIKLVN
jgi:hypothetical protein